jgi:hypothetical protein
LTCRHSPLQYAGELIAAFIERAGGSLKGMISDIGAGPGQGLHGFSLGGAGSGDQQQPERITGKALGSRGS